MKKTVYEKLKDAEQSPAWNRAGAWVITNKETKEYVGKVMFKFPKDGAGRLEAFMWDWTAKESRPIQHGTASGYGYDKKTAALGGMKFGNIKLIGQGKEWDGQLRDAGYDVWGII